MNRYTLAGFAAVLFSAGAALAQPAPAAPGAGGTPGGTPGATAQNAASGNDAADAPDSSDGPDRHRRPHWDRGGYRDHDRGRMHRMMRMHARKHGAFFHFQHGESEVTLRCAPDEPMKACVDAAGVMLDKLAAARANRPQQ